MGIDVQVGTELEFYLLDPETVSHATPEMTATVLSTPPSWNVLGRSASRSGRWGFRSNSPIPNMPLARSR